jgi:hypothetical protein
MLTPSRPRSTTSSFASTERVLEIPEGCDFVTFIQHDGKPPSAEKVQQEERTTLDLATLRDRYREVHSNGTLDETTLDGIRQHFKHWVATLGTGFANVCAHNVIEQKHGPLSSVGMSDEVDLV